MYVEWSGTVQGFGEEDNRLLLVCVRQLYVIQCACVGMA